MRDSHVTHWMRQVVVLGCCFNLVVVSLGEAAEPQVKPQDSKAKPVQVESKIRIVPLVGTSDKLNIIDSIKVPAGTHEQIAVIEVGSKLIPGMRINTFCLDKAGNLLAACGSGPGEIRVFNPDGKLLETWNVPIAPDAINVDQDGTIYVAGSGKLLKLDDAGKILMTKEAPHAKAVKESNAKLREQVVQQMKARSSTVVNMVPRLEKMIQQIKDKSKMPTEQDKKRILSYERILEQYKQMEQAAKKTKEPTDQEIDAQVESMSKRKLQVSSLSANEKEIFIACSAIQGYGYEVWRTDKNFDNPTVIVKGLRG
ncbi:MAG: hypothetical protein KDA77_14635, partial [Planctomycetaceae bacterium]|nr:hypothetical protein [Planctomycetaceae bacterium]